MNQKVILKEFWLDAGDTQRKAAGRNKMLLKIMVEKWTDGQKKFND